MSEFVTNMFQYDVTVGITRSEVIFVFFCCDCITLLLWEPHWRSSWFSLQRLQRADENRRMLAWICSGTCAICIWNSLEFCGIIVSLHQVSFGSIWLETGLCNSLNMHLANMNPTEYNYKVNSERILLRLHSSCCGVALSISFAIRVEF